MAEYLAQNRRNGLPDHAGMPAVTAGVHLTLRRVLNLNDRAVRRALRLTGTSMTSGSHDPSPVELLTQAIGRLAWSEGYEAILVPSAARVRCSNIVVFPDKLSPGQIVPINEDNLRDSSPIATLGDRDRHINPKRQRGLPLRRHATTSTPPRPRPSSSAPEGSGTLGELIVRTG